jgi:hypothetical protein
MASWKFAYFQAGGRRVVASAFACFDFLFDFVALCGRIGADAAFALAAVASSAGRRDSRDNRAATLALYGWRGAAGDPSGFARGTGGSGDATSHHPGDRAEGQATTGKADAHREASGAGAQPPYAL